MIKISFICEIGINHNGSFKEAKKLIDLAHKAGAECVKHQAHNVKYEMIDEAKNYPWKCQNINI